MNVIPKKVTYAWLVQCTKLLYKHRCARCNHKEARHTKTTLRVFCWDGNIRNRELDNLVPLCGNCVTDGLAAGHPLTAVPGQPLRLRT